MELVGARACANLDLCGAASFDINGRNDHAKLFDHVGSNCRGRSKTLRMPAIIHSHPIQLNVHVAGSAGLNTGKGRAGTAITNYTRHDDRQVHHVPAHQG